MAVGVPACAPFASARARPGAFAGIKSICRDLALARHAQSTFLVRRFSSSITGVASMRRLEAIRA